MTASDTIELCKAIGAIATPILVAWFGYLSIKKSNSIHKQLNSMRDQENATNRKLGQREGEASEKAKQDSKKS